MTAFEIHSLMVSRVGSRPWPADNPIGMRPKWQRSAVLPWRRQSGPDCAVALRNRRSNVLERDKEEKKQKRKKNERKEKIPTAVRTDEVGAYEGDSEDPGVADARVRRLVASKELNLPLVP